MTGRDHHVWKSGVGTESGICWAGEAVRRSESADCSCAAIKNTVHANSTMQNEK